MTQASKGPTHANLSTNQIAPQLLVNIRSEYLHRKSETRKTQAAASSFLQSDGNNAS